MSRRKAPQSTTPVIGPRNRPSVSSALLPFCRCSLNGGSTGSRIRYVNGPGSWSCILIAVILTSFFVPNMLRKGTVDMLLVKPIHRVTLLLYKYIGGLSFVFSMPRSRWAASGWRSDCAPASGRPASSSSIPGITFYFAILYAVSVLIGVLTRSPIVASRHGAGLCDAPVGRSDWAYCGSRPRSARSRTKGEAAISRRGSTSTVDVAPFRAAAHQGP